MRLASYWHRIHHLDERARALADRHYSRRTPGAREFVGPGHKVVLLHFIDDLPVALWASQRPAPASGIPRADGLDAWDCSIFRREHGDVPASELVKEAVAITLYEWRDVLPADGFVTTIDPRKVRPIKRRGKDSWGYSYLRAGWQHLRRTKVRDLIMLQLPLASMLEHEPVMPLVERPLFETDGPELEIVRF